MSPKPISLPGLGTANGYNIRAAGIAEAEETANDLREAGYTIYAVALGNPNVTIEGDKPDQALERVAERILTRLTY